MTAVIDASRQCHTCGIHYSAADAGPDDDGVCLYCAEEDDNA